MVYKVIGFKPTLYLHRKRAKADRNRDEVSGFTVEEYHQGKLGNETYIT